MPEEKPWHPPDPIYYPEWEDTDYVRVNTTQEDDPDRPIPYIVDLSVEGVLIVGWDRLMKPPANFTEIPPTKLAVEEDFNVEQHRFYETRGRYSSDERSKARR